jgi:hypothetical protein
MFKIRKIKILLFFKFFFILTEINGTNNQEYEEYEKYKNTESFKNWQANKNKINKEKLEAPLVEKTNEKGKKIGVFLSFRFLNGIYFLLSLGLGAIYIANDLINSTFDIPDFLMFFSFLFTNIICNWFAKPKDENKCSKKRFTCLFVNLISMGLLISGIVCGYFLDVIKDCNLFTGAENCKNSYTLWLFIISIFLFFITFLKIFL